MEEIEDEPPAKRIKASSVGGGSFGGSMEEVLIGSKGLIRKTEMTRIITKTLYSLGFNESGALLEKESGVSLYSYAVNDLQKQIAEGECEKSLDTLSKIGHLDEGLWKSARLLILKQKFFEFLVEDQFKDAVYFLRNKITPPGIDTKHLHELSSCIVSSSKRRATLGVDVITTRGKLFNDLQEILPPHILIPSGRLEDLIEQALCTQKEECYYHNAPDSTLSLYSNHKCGFDQIPSDTTQVLREHKGAVRFCQFSNKGKYLASASDDKSAIIWEVSENGMLKLRHNLNGHQSPVSMVSWSHDDCQLLTCGGDVRHWDVNSGQCCHVYEIAVSNVNIHSCCWSSDETQVYAGLKNSNICGWDLNGTETFNLDVVGAVGSPRKIAVTKDSNKIVVQQSDNTMMFRDMETNVARTVDLHRRIFSFSLSSDDGYLLVNHGNDEIILWRNGDKLESLLSYTAHKQCCLSINSCFGGFDQVFVASGSEDSQVYIWLRKTGEILQILPGHSGAVASVSWSPNCHMLASASYDGTIHIWGRQKLNFE